MKVFSASQIKPIINAFEEKGLECIDTLGSKLDVITKSIIRYSAYDPNIKLFTVTDHYNSMDKTIGFVLEDCVLDYSDVKNTFGPLRASYSFRDILTEFDVFLPLSKVSKVYFRKKNRYEDIGGNKFIEIEPKGKKTEIPRLVFDRFYLEITL